MSNTFTWRTRSPGRQHRHLLAHERARQVRDLEGSRDRVVVGQGHEVHAARGAPCRRPRGARSSSRGRRAAGPGGRPVRSASSERGGRSASGPPPLHSPSSRFKRCLKLSSIAAFRSCEKMKDTERFRDFGKAAPSRRRHVLRQDVPPSDRGRDGPRGRGPALRGGCGRRAIERPLEPCVAAAEEQRFPLPLRVVSLQEVLAAEDLLKRFLGLSIEDLYNLMLRRRFTALLQPLLRLLHRLIALRRRVPRPGPRALAEARRGRRRSSP